MKPLTEKELAIAKCIGRAVAPYAFKRECYHNDGLYAKNVPFTNIEHEARNIAKLICLNK